MPLTPRGRGMPGWIVVARRAWRRGLSVSARPWPGPGRRAGLPDPPARYAGAGSPRVPTNPRRCARAAMLTGTHRLSNPPHEAPRPNRRKASTMRSSVGIRDAAREFDGQQAIGAAAIALPQRMAGIARQGRAQDARHFGASLQPFGHAQRVAAMHRHPRRHGAHAAQDQVGIVGAHGLAHLSTVVRSSGAQARSVVTTVPIMTSAWPPRYLVAAVTEISAPSARAGTAARSPRCCPPPASSHGDAPVPPPPAGPSFRRPASRGIPHRSSGCWGVSRSGRSLPSGR